MAEPSKTLGVWSFVEHVIVTGCQCFKQIWQSLACVFLAEIIRAYALRKAILLGAIGLVYWVFVFAGSLLLGFLVSLVLVRIYEAVTGAPGRRWSTVLPRYGYLLGFVFVMTLVEVLVWWGVFLVIADWSQPIQGVLVTGLGLLQLYVMLRLLMMFPELLIGDKHWKKSIARAWAMTKGRFLHLLIRLVLLAVVLGLLFFMVAALLSLFGKFWSMHLLPCVLLGGRVFVQLFFMQMFLVLTWLHLSKHRHSSKLWGQGRKAAYKISPAFMKK
jgi:membrane-anchored glycerophosphoryl diester phosphodiesterase (GDPDase)